MASQGTGSVFACQNEIPPAVKVPELNGLAYLIGGELGAAEQGADVYSPLYVRSEPGQKSQRAWLGKAASLKAADGVRALEAARAAFGQGSGSWACMEVSERLERMEEFVAQMKGWEETFALLEMWEIGKPLPLCRDEFQRTVQYIEDTMAALRSMKKSSARIHQAGDFVAQVKRCPLGIVLCMGPFNYPLNETFALLIPALVMGNTIIMKPPRYGCLCTIPLLPVFAEVFPPGVINVINGEGEEIITPLMRSGQISVLGFIGSTRVANLLIDHHPANNRLRTILGLEAKNPAFVFPDADLDLAVRECVQGALEFNGQRCTSLKHIWVHEDIADPFLDLLSQRVDELRCGMPWEEEVMITPLPEENKSEWLAGLVDDACSKGARIVNPRGGQYEKTLFYPTVLFPVDDSMRIYQVEQFGPVIPVSTFSQLEDLELYLKASGYGQQASIFSSRPETAAPLIDLLVNQVSRVNLNARCRRGPDELPFTGRKDSAEGTLSVTDALRSFSIRSLVVANEEGRDLFFSVLASGKSRFLRI